MEEFGSAERRFHGKGDINLVIDVGLETQRRRAAKVLRVDDYLDLALLKVDADPDLTSLDLGSDEALSELAPVRAFGFTSGQTFINPEKLYPPVSVIAGKIAELHGPRQKLEGIQFDARMSPGEAGGPVLDASGKVIGVAAATVSGKSITLAIPAGRLADFLAAPKMSFNPPALTFHNRHKPVPWSIKLEPATTEGRLPEGLSVHLTIAHGDIADPKRDGTAPTWYIARTTRTRTAVAKPASDGTFKVELAPLPSDDSGSTDAIEAYIQVKSSSAVLATVR